MAVYRRSIRSWLRRIVLLTALLAPAAHAAGMTTHALIADHGRQALPEGPLKTVLTEHRASLLAGAIHPDGGYGSGSVFPEDREMAERAHWEDFNDAFITHLQNIGCDRELLSGRRPSQPLGWIDVNALSDRCGKLIAFALGNAAHGLGDETWDSLFEPVVRENDLDAADASTAQPTHPHCQALFGAPADPQALLEALRLGREHPIVDALNLGPEPSIEYAMDIVAIAEQKLWLEMPLLVHPPLADLVEVHRINRPALGVTEDMVRRAFLVSKAGVAGERLLVQRDYDRMRALMPWAASNYYLSSGGVIDSAQAVARLYQHLWAKLLGAPRNMAIIAVHPVNGEEDVPYRRDAAQLRIRAFTGQSAAETTVESPADGDALLTLTDDEGAQVPGRLQSGIYDPNWGHVIDFLPDHDLRPGQWYRVSLRAGWSGWVGGALEQRYVWRFRTAETSE